MNKSLLRSLAIVFLMVAMAACGKEDKGTTFDSSLIPGKWTGQETISGTVHNIYYVYQSNGRGYTWSVTDGEDEDDALNDPDHWFDWRLDKATLKLTFYSGGIPTVPQFYTVKTLSSTQFVYTDDSTGTRFTNTRVN